MTIPFKYNWRNLRVRWRSTLAATLGIALVVAVFVMVMSLARGGLRRRGGRVGACARTVARRFENCRYGQRFHSGKGNWEVVGIFDAQRTAYDSEIWVDADEAREAFNRSFYGSIVCRPVDEAAAAALIRRIENDKQMQLRALTETESFPQQTQAAAPIQIFGACLAAIMSIGAAFSAMNTMHAAVGSPAREIGTLRVLGFRPRSVYVAFLLESLVVAAMGGVLGRVRALPLPAVATRTFNSTTFADLGFA